MHTLRFLPTLLALASTAAAQLELEWTATEPLGSSLSSGFQGLTVDAAGNSYLTGIGGVSSNTDVFTVAYGSDGERLWSSTFDGAQSWHDQGRGIALAPDGSVWVCGNTPGPTFVARVLLLQYDAGTGEELRAVEFSSDFVSSESALDLVVDGTGNLFVAATTGGDGSDVMVLSFDATGALRWRRTWDGPAFGPFSQDVPNRVVLGPAGEVFVLITGIGGDSLPDYVLNRYDPASGDLAWSATWGGTGTQSPVDVVVDAAGDAYVTGTAINGWDQFSTVKFSGVDGAVLWQEYDTAGLDDNAFALALDGLGGVYVTGDRDPDGNDSNFNEDFFTVKRDAATGAFVWSHLYGDPCVGCFDRPTDVLVDPAGFAVVAGTTSSDPFGAGATITFVLEAASGRELDRDALTGVGSGELAFDEGLAIVNGGQRRDADTGAVELTAFEYASLSGCGVDAAAVAVPDAGGLNVPLGLASWPEGGVPTIGDAGFALAVDDPTDACGITPGASTYLLLADAPGSFLVAGLGCAPGGPGEVQILPVPFPPTLGPVTWSGPGQPAVHPLPVPDDLALCGYQLFVQALFVDPQAPAADRHTVTNRLDLTAGH